MAVINVRTASTPGPKPRHPRLDYRMTLYIEVEFLRRVDTARGILSRGEFLRRGLESLVDAMERNPETVLNLPALSGERKDFPFEVPSALAARAKALVAAGRAASVIDLVRGAGAVRAEGAE